MSGTAGEHDGRRLRGDATRARILRNAAEVASVEGLDGLSLAGLGQRLDVSKSNVHALFGTKEDLQLATVADARRRFIDVVVRPALGEPEGIRRLRSLVGHWLDYVEGREFPGGCFVTHCVNEFARRPGPVRDALLAVRSEWLDLLRAQLAAARADRRIAPGADVHQLAFEIDGLLVAANTGSITGDSAAIERGRAGVERLLRGARPRPRASASRP